MNVNELAEHIAQQHDISKKAARTMVRSILEKVATATAKGEEVNLAGFGRFKTQHRPARQGRNPQTGQTVTIPAAQKVTFRPAKALRDKVNGS